MQGRKHLSGQLFYQISLSELVPADNFYRLLGQSMDFHFLYAATSRYYGSEGNASIDPVVLPPFIQTGL
jgi:hypothetical protein